MLAKKYKSEIISIQNPFKGIYTLEFKAIQGKFKFFPGQFLHIAIDSDYDGVGQWPDSRCFSIQSNSSETTIRVTYAVKGEFTSKMEANLKVGSEVWLKLPYGELFSQPHSKQNTVFIAGGTGVTPFLSLFTDMSFYQYITPRVYLGFRALEYNIYAKELLGIKQLTVFYQDKNGVIDIERIFNENGIEATYFISGPPTMIKIFKAKFIEHGVNAMNILTDDWE